MHVDHKYVVEIQNLVFHGNLLNGNNCFGTHAQHMVITPILQMQGYEYYTVFIFKLQENKTIKL